jgi:hypothetical protein
VGERIVSALQRGEPPLALDAYAIEKAADEWLLTSDRHLLTPWQRALCGTLLLEAFAGLPEHARVSPSIAHAIGFIVPQVGRMPESGLRAVRRVVERLLARGPRLRLDAKEQAELALAAFILRRAAGEKPAMGPLVKRLRAGLEEMEQHEMKAMRAWCRRKRIVVLLPETVLSVVRGPGVR